ncbi:MAG TPA: GTP-binding protein [Panacibacter sp.]|nr:GTP-binding protein [Panacibacter sp.]HNP46121.1 GTP-binding protein [Panacibacter sp.]
MRLFLISGFLGSGKTTSIAQACRQLISSDTRVAVITNDQGLNQVDSAYLKGLRLPVGEVAEGCFCCRFDELAQTIDSLADSAKPEIIFAETVGSCTDLVATVVKPLQRRYHDFRIMLCSFADAWLLYSLISGTSAFIDESVQYLFRKQLEEADMIVLNKCDLLNDSDLEKVKHILQSDYPGKAIHCQNAYNRHHITEWLEFMNQFSFYLQRRSLDIDYDLYATGEAMLAWLDMKISVHSTKMLAIKIALALAESMDHNLRSARLTIGHLKFLFDDGKHTAKLSFTTTKAKQKRGYPELSDAKHIEMLINARVQTDPSTLLEILRTSIEESMTSTGCRIVVHESAAFTPGYPKPLHRIV